MSLFIREKRDGTRGPGYLAYLLGGAAIVAAVSVLHRRATVPAGPASAVRAAPSRIGPITQPAAVMARVEVADRPPPPEARSYRLGAPAVESPRPAPAVPRPGAFDAIGAAIEAAPPAAAAVPASVPLDAEMAGPSRAAYPQLPPSFAAEGPGDRGGLGSAQLLGYRDAAADRPAPAREEPPAPAAPPVPRGTLIRVYLLTTVDTSNPAAVLQLAAARSLVFGGRIRLPFGVRFLGRLAGEPMRDRLNLAVDTVVYPDGRERPISAAAVESDESGSDLRPGVAAWYFPPPTWVQLAPYVSDAATGYLGLLESRARQPVSVGIGGLSLQAAGAGADAPLYQASAQAVQDFTQARLKELGLRYESYHLIPAGTAFWLQLEADFHG